MADRWCFRTNWRGQLILQKKVDVWNVYSILKGFKWVDATAEDLLVFAKELK